MSLVAHKEDVVAFVEVVSDTFQPFPACYNLFQVISFLTIDDVTECFDLQIYYKSTSTKECKCHYRTGQLFWITERGKRFYKVGQVLPSEAIFIRKWGNFFYKVGQ